MACSSEDIEDETPIVGGSNGDDNNNKDEVIENSKLNR